MLFGGSGEPLTKILGEELIGRTPNPEDFLPGAKLDTPPHNHAMLYGASAHAIDFDDTLPPALAAHAGSAVFGAIMALLPSVDASGADILSAALAGYETAGRIGALVHSDHYLKGFHPTSTIGGFAAAAAAGHLLKFDPQQLQQALGLAATQASGLKCVFGSMTKPFNAGNAAASGVLAARLVSQGFTAPDNGLEADKGYLDMFIGKPEDERQVAPPDRFAILGNAFKFHAACHATHPMIEALLSLREANDFSFDDIERVAVETSELGLKTASIGAPTTGLECKFSYSYVAAATLAGHDMAADETYTDTASQDPMLDALRQKVQTSSGAKNAFVTQVTLQLKDGDPLVQDFDFNTFMRDHEKIKPRLLQKFTANTEPALGATKAGELKDSLMSLL